MRNLPIIHSLDLQEIPTITGTTEQKNILNPFAFFGYSADVVAKSTTEPGNSIKTKGEQHAKRAFFVRSIRIPKKSLTRTQGIFSMVACNGKGIALCCFPLVAVFQPVTRYRQQAWKLQAVTLINKPKDTVKMIYKFLCLDREATHFRTQVLTLTANSEEQARFSLNARWRCLVTVAKNLPDTRPIAFTSSVEVANV